MLKHFKISAAQDKSIFGSSASLSMYAKKYYNVMILTRVKWAGSLIGKPLCVAPSSWRKTEYPLVLQII